ncbi:hypothetical protein [Hyphomicrobium sp. LHD-15]|uniref:hypothetical protein n=1 Tax=Hyphomicrobium sp. LHD-15 TaxID=3072142 RepID=UPI00280C92EE|nr:hypothetical protein [Hyphomicrobium sp. LHD-15]MDQ8699208.1 hypothetical protein [Hyphomicrobium sp. LHD-15]
MTNNLDLSTVQKGKVTEALVASMLVLGSIGRLSPFVPISDDCGIDLIVLDKQTQGKLPIQIKSRIANPARNTVQFNIRKASVGELGNRLLLCVLFDPETIALTASWLIPMSRIRDLSQEKRDKYTLSPNILVGSRDRYQSFRVNTAVDLANAVLHALAENTPRSQFD